MSVMKIGFLDKLITEKIADMALVTDDKVRIDERDI